MGRKNIFETALDHQAPNVTGLQGPAPSAPSRRHGAPALETLGSSLRDMSESGIQELDPALIVDSGVQDRIELDPDEIGRLAESIRTYGQQVPILVRPHPDSMNRFIIVYGRRRLAAIRKIGPGARVKAIVRHLAEDAAILAQGQENNLRVDPSYIEKALFVRELKSAGYDSQIIQDAQMARDDGVDLRVLIPTPDRSQDSTGSDRFAGIFRQAKEIIEHSVRDGSARHDGSATVTAGTAAGFAPPASRPLALSGRHIGTLKKTGRSLSLNVSLRHQPQFGQWLEDNADEILRLLHDRWTESRDGG